MPSRRYQAVRRNGREGWGLGSRPCDWIRWTSVKARILIPWYQSRSQWLGSPRKYFCLYDTKKKCSSLERQLSRVSPCFTTEWYGLPMIATPSSIDVFFLSFGYLLFGKIYCAWAAEEAASLSVTKYEMIIKNSLNILPRDRNTSLKSRSLLPLFLE